MSQVFGCSNGRTQAVVAMSRDPHTAPQGALLERAPHTRHGIRTFQPSARHPLAPARLCHEPRLSAWPRPRPGTYRKEPASSPSLGNPAGALTAGGRPQAPGASPRTPSRGLVPPHRSGRLLTHRAPRWLPKLSRPWRTDLARGLVSAPWSSRSPARGSPAALKGHHPRTVEGLHPDPRSPASPTCAQPASRLARGRAPGGSRRRAYLEEGLRPGLGDPGTAGAGRRRAMGRSTQALPAAQLQSRAPRRSPAPQPRRRERREEERREGGDREGGRGGGSCKEGALERASEAQRGEGARLRPGAPILLPGSHGNQPPPSRPQTGARLPRTAPNPRRAGGIRTRPVLREGPGGVAGLGPGGGNRTPALRGGGGAAEP